MQASFVRTSVMLRLVHVPSGFYGDVVEFLVTTDYECVNVLCTDYPEMRVRAPSEVPE